MGSFHSLSRNRCYYRMSGHNLFLQLSSLASSTELFGIKHTEVTTFFLNLPYIRNEREINKYVTKTF